MQHIGALADWQLNWGLTLHSYLKYGETMASNHIWFKSFKVSNDPNFEQELTDVVGLYMNPPENAVVSCVDEKSSIQALDRTQPGLLMADHQINRWCSFAMTNRETGRSPKRYSMASRVAICNAMATRLIRMLCVAPRLRYSAALIIRAVSS